LTSLTSFVFLAMSSALAFFFASSTCPFKTTAPLSTSIVDSCRVHLSCRPKRREKDWPALSETFVARQRAQHLRYVQ
jgi:hypothetical protein